MTAGVVSPASVASSKARFCLLTTLAVGAALTVVAAALVISPGLRFTGWRWILVSLAVGALVLAAPAHRAAWAHLRRGRLDASALGTVGLAVCTAATVQAATSDASEAVAVSAVAPAALLALVARWRSDETFVEVPGWFVAACVALAVVAGAAWALTSSPGRGLVVAAAVLVAAGPTAQLAAGTAALRSARRSVGDGGIGLTDPGAVLTTAAVDTVLLDKDGTVTTGGLRVTSVDPVEPDHDRNLRWFAGALQHENTPEDRVARAIARLSGRGRVTEVTIHADGISGRVDRHPVRVGDPTWLGITTVPGTWTTVGVEVDARTLGTVTVADDVRPDADAGVRSLRSLGLQVVLCSADTVERTTEVGRTVGIDDVRAGLDADAQQRLLEQLDGEGRHVLHAVADGSTQRSLGLEDVAVTRIAGTVEVARAAVRAARRARLAAMVVGAFAAIGAAAGLVGPVQATVAAGAGVLLTLVVAQPS